MPIIWYNIVMTVGELVYKQAIEKGYEPDRAERLALPLNKAMESYKKVAEKMAEPLRALNSMVETMRPNLQAMSRISLPGYDEDEGSSLIPLLIRPVQDVRITNLEEIASASSKREVEFMTASYILPQNASWEFLDIKFLDGHFVKVSYPGMNAKKFDYKDMGFANMKTTRPDLKWKLLQSIAENDGALTKDTWDERFHRNIKYELNEGLKKFFGMETNPISHYTQKKGYRALFNIKSDR